MKHRIESLATVQGLSDGQIPWFFARASENHKYYPSSKLLRSENGLYEGSVFIGRGQLFRLYLVVLNQAQEQEVTQYLNERKQDGRWAVGMEQMPTSMPLAHQDVHRATCITG